MLWHAFAFSRFFLLLVLKSVQCHPTIFDSHMMIGYLLCICLHSIPHIFVAYARGVCVSGHNQWELLLQTCNMLCFLVPFRSSRSHHGSFVSRKPDTAPQQPPMQPGKQVCAMSPYFHCWIYTPPFLAKINFSWQPS